MSSNNNSDYESYDNANDSPTDNTGEFSSTGASNLTSPNNQFPSMVGVRSPKNTKNPSARGTVAAPVSTPKIANRTKFSVSARRSPNGPSTPVHNQYVIPSAAAAMAMATVVGHLNNDINNTAATPSDGNNNGSAATVDANGNFIPRTTITVNNARVNSNAFGPNRVVLHLAKSKYRVLRRIAKLCKMNVIEVDEGLEGREDFNILWGDTMIPLDRLRKFQPWQHFNHFASMFNITRKHNLSITMGKMQKGLPEHFTFVPRSWSLKVDRANFEEYYANLQQQLIEEFGVVDGSSAAPVVDEEEKPVFIMKPNSGCQGKGIVLTRDPLKEVDTPEDYVVQEYIARPLLIENRKFDLRVYVLVTSMKYPSILIFNEGLVRLCAEPYEQPNAGNMANVCKHLTNFAVNKKSESYQAATSQGDNGSKRNFAWFNKWLDETLTDDMLGNTSAAAAKRTAAAGAAKKNAAVGASGAPPSRSAQMWAAIDHIIVKTVLSAQPKVRHAYNMLFPHGNDGYTCFEVLGFDILIDHKLQPWLMEVNHTPSFVTGTQMDLQVKGTLLKEVMTIINPTSKDRVRWKARQMQMRSQEILLGKKQDGEALEGGAAGGTKQGNNDNNDDENDNSNDENDSPLLTSPTTAAEAAAALYYPETAANAQFPNLQDFAINTDAYRKAHECLEDGRSVNFRRVYPVPEEHVVAKAHTDYVQQQILEALGENDNDDDHNGRSPSAGSNASSSSNSAKRSAHNNKARPVKENNIPHCSETIPINHQVNSIFAQCPDLLDLRRAVYDEILGYATIHNAAKRDPNRITAAVRNASAANAAAAGATAEEQQQLQQ